MSKTHAYKKEKLQVKLKEQEAIFIDKREKERNERFDKILQQRNDNIMAMMGQQQQLQSMFMAQQQQQTQALMTILGNNTKK